jgi:predicted small metal-binding protein
MKRFACGDVVPGCKATFEGESIEDVLTQVAEHARVDHKLESVPAEVVDQVKRKIRDHA